MEGVDLSPSEETKKKQKQKREEDKNLFFRLNLVCVNAFLLQLCSKNVVTQAEQ